MKEGKKEIMQDSKKERKQKRKKQERQRQGKKEISKERNNEKEQRKKEEHGLGGPFSFTGKHNVESRKVRLGKTRTSAVSCFGPWTRSQLLFFLGNTGVWGLAYLSGAVSFRPSARNRL